MLNRRMLKTLTSVSFVLTLLLSNVQGVKANTMWDIPQTPPVISAPTSASDWNIVTTDTITGAKNKKTEEKEKKDVVEDNKSVEKTEKTSFKGSSTTATPTPTPSPTPTATPTPTPIPTKEPTPVEVEEKVSDSSVPTMETVKNNNDEEDMLYFGDTNASKDDAVPTKPEVLEENDSIDSKGTMDMPDMSGIDHSEDDPVIDIDGPNSKSDEDIRQAEEERPDTGDISKPAKAKKAPTVMETTKWNLSEGNRTNKISIRIPAGETRFEMFYTAGAPMPNVTFSSCDGNIYRTGEDFTNSKTKFICRPGNKIEGFSDVDYCVMYFSAPVDPGTWTAEITLDKGTKEFMFLKSSVPNEWEGFSEEYRTNPEEMCLWFLSSASDYSVDELVNLASVDTNPGANSIVSTDAPVIEEVDYTIPIIVGAFVLLLAALIGVTVYIVQRSNREQRERTEKRISKANQKLKERKESQDKHLADVLKEMDEDYSDDDYFSEKEESDDDDIKIPVQKKMLNDDELTFDDEHKMSMKDMSEDETESFEMPSWLDDAEDSSDDSNFF